MRPKQVGAFCFTLLIAFLFQNVIGQNIDSITIQKNIEKRHYVIVGAFQRGHVFTTNKFLAGSNLEHEVINSFQSVSLKIGNQSTRNENWHVNYNFPFYGVGMYMANFIDTKEIGNPIALFGFFSAPFVRHNKFLLNYDLEFGFAFNWNSFNPIDNPNNISIGSKQTFYLDAGLNAEYQISKIISVNAGFSVTHFSNGDLKKPNYGINTIAPKVNLKFNLFNDKIDYSKRAIPEFIKRYEWLVSVYTGVKNVIYDSLNVDLITKYKGVYFPIYGLSSGINRQISNKSKIGFGFSACYDGSHNAQVNIDKGKIVVAHTPYIDKMEISIYPSYELIISKMSILIQPSFYVMRQKSITQTPTFYQRVGLKYHFKNDTFVGISLNAFKFQISDFIEWHFGYRIVWKDK
jgi:hypothetical protein